jgi:hypothetical protein
MPGRDTAPGFFAATAWGAAGHFGQTNPSCESATLARGGGAIQVTQRETETRVGCSDRPSVAAAIAAERQDRLRWSMIAKTYGKAR